MRSRHWWRPRPLQETKRVCCSGADGWNFDGRYLTGCKDSDDSTAGVCIWDGISSTNGPFLHPYCTQVFGEHTLVQVYSLQWQELQSSAPVIPRNILARDRDECVLGW